MTNEILLKNKYEINDQITENGKVTLKRKLKVELCKKIYVREKTEE